MKKWKEAAQKILSSCGYPIQLGESSITIYSPEQIILEVDSSKDQYLLIVSASNVEIVERIKAFLVVFQENGFLPIYSHSDNTRGGEHA